MKQPLTGGFRLIELNLPTNVSDAEIQKAISRRLKVREFSFTIERKSLDARKKGNIHWKYRLGVTSPQLKGGNPKDTPKLEIPRIRSKCRAVVVGSGPAGIFSALVLAEAGVEVTLVEQGDVLTKRNTAIEQFEAGGSLNPVSNYAFGEGGAGTYSDGKLTSRTKSIKPEKQYILETYAECGGPEEILWLSSPHLGSDRLQVLTANMRNKLTSLGGKILFNTKMTDILTEKGHVRAIQTDGGTLEADAFFLAPGHSHFPTFRMLIRRGVPFITKPFAIGMRAEHPQELINRAQWGASSVPGLKAAEYRLTHKPASPEILPGYSFCMCPGGKVVPATPAPGLSVVNGMSEYLRDSPFANAAVVAGIRAEELTGGSDSPLAVLDALESLERQFYEIRRGYDIPAIRICDFLAGKESASIPDNSFPFSLFPDDPSRLFPENITRSLREALTAFSSKIKGYEEGILMGLESKTSSPIQVVRDAEGTIEGFSGLYLCGEGSGRTGGIVSSAADGIRNAIRYLKSRE